MDLRTDLGLDPATDLDLVRLTDLGLVQRTGPGLADRRQAPSALLHLPATLLNKSGAGPLIFSPGPPFLPSTNRGVREKAESAQRFWKSGEPSRSPATSDACLSAGDGIGVVRSITCTKAARTGMVPACFGPGRERSTPARAAGPCAASWSACCKTVCLACGFNTPSRKTASNFASFCAAVAASGPLIFIKASRSVAVPSLWLARASAMLMRLSKSPEFTHGPAAQE